MGVRHRDPDLYLLVERDARQRRHHRAPPSAADRRPRGVHDVRAGPDQVRRGRGAHPDPGAGRHDQHHRPATRGARVDAAQSAGIRARRCQDGGLAAVTAEREMTFLLAEIERRVLQHLAARVPRSIRSNHLTALGTIAAAGAGTAYALTNYSPAWLWVASLMLVINCLGDSLDGTLARVRGTQRPKYGYYLDHVVDAFSTAVIGLGIGLSPYVNLGLALGLVVVYLALSINVYLESSVFGVFKISYGRIGPTEVRLLLVILNTMLAVAALLQITGPLPIRVVANWTLAILLTGMVALFVGRFARNLYRLAKLEPQRFRWWEQG